MKFTLKSPLFRKLYAQVLIVILYSKSNFLSPYNTKAGQRAVTEVSPAPNHRTHFPTTLSFRQISFLLIFQEYWNLCNDVVKKTFYIISLNKIWLQSKEIKFWYGWMSDDRMIYLEGSYLFAILGGSKRL